MNNVENKEKNEMSLSDETQFQTDNLSRILKLSCLTAIGHLSRIKKEIALEFGSRLPSCPRMTLFLLAFFLSFTISESWAQKCISDGKTTTGGKYEGTNTSCTSCGLNCNWEVTGKCSECNSGLLEKDGGCVSSCGEGYSQM